MKPVDYGNLTDDRALRDLGVFGCVERDALSATHHAEVALETTIVTTAKRILKSVQVDACWRIAFADTFCYVRRHVDVRPPHEINEIDPKSVVRTASILPWSWPSVDNLDNDDIAAKYARTQCFCIQPSVNGRRSHGPESRLRRE